MVRTPATNDEAKAILKRATDDELGEFGELIWSRVLALSGWHYVSLTKICEGGAPLARGSSNKLILPDFDAYKDGANVFVESKAKRQSVIYQNRKQERHGINERNYFHYREIQRVSGRECCIGLVELQREVLGSGALDWSGALLFERLNNLFEPMSEFPENPPKVYWPRKRFVELDAFDPRELFMLANGEKSESYSFELNQILFPTRQLGLFAM